MLTIALQIDPIESLKFESDTSILLGLEAQNRGHKLFCYQPKDMFLENGQVCAYTQNLELKDDPKKFYSLGKAAKTNLAEMDIILIRQDPPFNLDYITSTYLLETLPPATLVLNNPTEIRNCPEKLFVSRFKQFTPPTLISRNKQALLAFKEKYKDVILKPLYGHGGAGVIRSKAKDNPARLINQFLQDYDHPFIMQTYIPQIEEGDTRIMLIGGEIAGGMRRTPPEGEVRSNLASGGTASVLTLTRHDLAICAALKPELQKRNIVFAGVDIIGEYLIEINITSPTGLRVVNRLENKHTEKLFWNVVEKKVKGLINKPGGTSPSRRKVLKIPEQS